MITLENVLERKKLIFVSNESLERKKKCMFHNSLEGYFSVCNLKQVFVDGNTLM